MAAEKMAWQRNRGVEMLTEGQIEPSGSPLSAFVVLVMKIEGGTMFCVDYCQRLNNITDNISYPLPWIDDTLDLLDDKKWFTALV